MTKSWVTPKELKLPYYEIERIFIDHCPGEGAHWTSLYMSAHAHLCPEDKFYNSVCIPEKYVRNKFGKPSICIRHEYAHILAGPTPNATVICGDSRGCFKYPNGTSSDDLSGHHEGWKEIMRRWGLPPLRVIDEQRIFDE